MTTTPTPPPDGMLIVAVILLALGLHIVLSAAVESWQRRRRAIRRTARKSAH